jgi:hypothetical protein
MQVKNVPSIQFAISCFFLVLNPNIYLISDTLNLRTCFSPLSPSEIEEKNYLSVLLQLLLSTRMWMSEVQFMCMWARILSTLKNK